MKMGLVSGFLRSLVFFSLFSLAEGDLGLV